MAPQHRLVRCSRLTAALVALGFFAACSSSGNLSGSTTTSAPRATTTSTTTAAPRPVLRLVTINVLHGALCDDGAHCLGTQRIALLGEWLRAFKCPPIVALEEVASWHEVAIRSMVRHRCGGKYRIVFPHVASKTFLDREMLLTTFTVTSARRRVITDGERSALRVRLTTPLGSLVVVVTHVGTGANDFGDFGRPCTATACPPPCDPKASQFLCQMIELRDFAKFDERGAVGSIIAGDLNLVASSKPLQVLFDAGYVDTFRAAGNRECDPQTGDSCTSGRDDTHLAVLRDKRAIDTVRVDYVLFHPAARCPRPDYHPRDGEWATGLFASTPAPAAAGHVVWVSDHAGVALSLRCT